MSASDQNLSPWLAGTGRARIPDLGEREMAVMEVLWTTSRASAQEVRDRLAVSISLSTVQSTLERLHRKRLVGRRKEGRAYGYWPLLSRAQLIGGLLRDLAQDVAGGDLAPMLSGFVDYVAAESPELAGPVSRALSLQNQADAEWEMPEGPGDADGGASDD